MEILSMRWSNVDLVKRQIYIPMTKSGKPGFALLNDQAFELLNQMKKERNKASDFVFPSKSKTGHLLDIRRTFQTIKSMARIEDFTIHSMRKVYASILINQNIPVAQIRDLLGHADIRTTMIYAHLNTKSLQDANEAAGKELEKFMA
jgi:integrase